jgi:hypothetical protein
MALRVAFIADVHLENVGIFRSDSLGERKI